MFATNINKHLWCVQRLFKYISGDNQGGHWLERLSVLRQDGYFLVLHQCASLLADSIKIPMTSPVAVHVSAGQGPFCKSTFSVAFFVPAEFQVS